MLLTNSNLHPSIYFLFSLTLCRLKGGWSPSQHALGGRWGTPYGQFRVSSSSDLHVVTLWEETHADMAHLLSNLKVKVCTHFVFYKADEKI